MNTPATLPETLAYAAERPGAITYIDEHGAERVTTYAELYGHALRVGGSLREFGLVPKDRVAFIVPDADEFLITLFGATVGGFVPTPLYPPFDMRRLSAYLEQTRRILLVAEPKVLVTTPAIRRVLGSLLTEVPRLRAILTYDELTGPALTSIVRPDPSDTVFIQFTSGSTSVPKGVVLSHACLDANVRALGGPSGLACTAEDVGVSWLPLFHDMGLVGMALGSMFHGVSSTLLAPRLFLRRPATWLTTISERRGTISFAPNFAYAYCTRRVRDRDIEGVDLSSWRVAGCGAEPIQGEALRAFARRFEPYGFRASAFLSCYGMAEHTLAVTFPALGDGLTIDTVRASDLTEHNVATPAGEQRSGTVSFVACGRPFPGHELLIVDEAGRGVAERTVGEILLRGPSVMKGYERLDDLTRSTLAHGWLHTGDLGYLSGGSLYVCGRKKDLIVVSGKNYYPQDVEWAASEVEGVRQGGVVAFGMNAFAGGKERVVLIVESRKGVNVEGLERRLRHAVMSCVGLRVDEIVIVPAGTLPKTSSGKVQRTRTRARYETGSLVRKRDTRLGLLGRLLASQWGYVRQALLGGRSGRPAGMTQ